MTDIPIYKQIMIISRALHEVGGMDFETANVQAHLYIYKSRFAPKIEAVSLVRDTTTRPRCGSAFKFKERFNELNKIDRLPIFPFFFCVRQCIEDFYILHSRNGKLMQYGYWKSIYEALTEHRICRRIFRNEFELSGCRQGSSDDYSSSKKKKGRAYFVEASYWISPSIVSHYAESNKITNLNTARKTLQEGIHRALRNTAPQNHEEVKAEFAKLLDERTSPEYIRDFLNP